MARSNDRREYINILTGVIGVLFVVVSWFLADKANQIKTDLTDLRNDLKSALAEIRGLGDRIINLEHKTH